MECGRRRRKYHVWKIKKEGAGWGRDADLTSLLVREEVEGSRLKLEVPPTMLQIWWSLNQYEGHPWAKITRSGAPRWIEMARLWPLTLLINVWVCPGSMCPWLEGWGGFCRHCSWMLSANCSSYSWATSSFSRGEASSAPPWSVQQILNVS